MYDKDVDHFTSFDSEDLFSGYTAVERDPPESVQLAEWRETNPRKNIQADQLLAALTLTSVGANKPIDIIEIVKTLETMPEFEEDPTIRNLGYLALLSRELVDAGSIKINYRGGYSVIKTSIS